MISMTDKRISMSIRDKNLSLQPRNTHKQIYKRKSDKVKHFASEPDNQLSAKNISSRIHHSSYPNLNSGNSQLRVNLLCRIRALQYGMRIEVPKVLELGREGGLKIGKRELKWILDNSMFINRIYLGLTWTDVLFL